MSLLNSYLLTHVVVDFVEAKIIDVIRHIFWRAQLLNSGKLSFYKLLSVASRNPGEKKLKINYM